MAHHGYVRLRCDLLFHRVEPRARRAAEVFPHQHRYLASLRRPQDRCVEKVIAWALARKLRIRTQATGGQHHRSNNRSSIHAATKNLR